MKKSSSNKKKNSNSFLINTKKKISNIKDNILSYNKLDNNSVFSIYEVVIIIVISILFGILIGYFIMYTRNPVVGAISDAKLNEVVSTYNDIVNNYYEEVNKEELADAAIKGMIDSLDDPYSNYMNTTVSEDFNETIDGYFVGVGVSVVFSEHYNKVVDVVSGGPADKAGIKVDDIIMEVDGTDAYDLYGNNLTKLIRGKNGTKVVLKIKRGDSEKNISIKRDYIEIESVSHILLDEDDVKIGYITIENMATNTYNQFENALKEMEKDGMQSLIIDVRGNPGGHLLQTKQILNLFFPKKTVIYQIESKKNKYKVYDTTKESRSYPIIILINKNSASASELLASCFKDNYKNIELVGETTYGKGTIQKSHELTTGSNIKYTTDKWLTSKGKWINKKGIKPTIEVKLNDDYYLNPSNGSDNQLQTAIDKLKEIINNN